jgi:hypothetical protein
MNVLRIHLSKYYVIGGHPMFQQRKKKQDGIKPFADLRVQMG